MTESIILPSRKERVLTFKIANDKYDIELFKFDHLIALANDAAKQTGQKWYEELPDLVQRHLGYELDQGECLMIYQAVETKIQLLKKNVLSELTSSNGADASGSKTKKKSAYSKRRKKS